MKAFVLLFLGLSCIGKAQRTALVPHTLRTLITTHEAHSIPAAEAIKGYPIRIRGVITLYDAYVDPRHVILFLHDATGSIFFTLPHGSQPLPPGTLVDLRGVSGMGDFAPVIEQPVATVIGKADRLPPTAQPVSLTYLLTGQEDGQWVKVEGVVHSAFVLEHNAILQIAMRDGMIVAKMPREQGADYSSLVDARVLIRAHAGPVFTGGGQMVGAQLLVPGLYAVEILDPEPADIFNQPITAISTLSSFGSVTSLPRRVHVQGKATLFWSGSLLCVQDAGHGLCARTLQRTPVNLGETVDVAGFTQMDESVPTFSDSTFRIRPSALASRTPAVPQEVTAEQALYGNYGSQLIAIQGQLIGRDLTSSDATLILSSGKYIFAVTLPKDRIDAVSRHWQDGSTLRVTGICSVKIDAERSAREEGAAAVRGSFRVLMRSSSDVEVLQRPSWWTPKHAVVVLAIVLAATLIVLCWVAVLSKRLKRQKHQISESEERFRYLAQHDFLTGLPTRSLLRERLDAALDAAKSSGTGLALLMLDLDKFKQINDSLGHHAGDEALKVTARRLMQIVRKHDTVARISGDEFVVLITDIVLPKEAEMVAAKVVNTLSAPFKVGDHDIPISASVGVCTGFGSDLNAESLLKSVDAAMYHAKAQGRNCFQFYTVDMASGNEKNLLFRAALARALQNSEMEVHYQPMVDLQSRELTGFEALMRWRSREFGLVMPEDFIPVAEDTGLILPLGEWILRQACHEIGSLEKHLGRSFLLSVNLSPKQVQQETRWPQIVERVLTEEGRWAKNLEFELTESILMDDSAQIRSTLHQLRALGVRLSVDDFGIGFSSLSYITRFVMDRLKIDRSFIRQGTREGGNIAVVRAMIAMAHGLSMQVVAEGVETTAEFDFLRNEGCDTAQGYLMSKPVPLHDLQALVERLGVQSGLSAADRPQQVPVTGTPFLLVGD